MEQPAARYCTVCATLLGINDLFCNVCGTQVKTPPTTSEASKVAPQFESSTPRREDPPAFGIPTNEQTSEQKLPSEAYRLASSFTLGVPKARYASISLTESVQTAFIIWIVLAVLTTIGTACAGKWWLGSLIALPIPLLFLAYTAFGRKYRLYVCTDGFVYCEGNDLTAIRWDEVISIERSEEIVRSYSSPTKYTPSSSSSRTRYLCTIFAPERMISLSSDHLMKAQDLYSIIAQEVARHKQ
jgi:hypothetical protein